MTNFFTSDWHIGHANIIRLCERPYSDVNHMNEAIISNYQSKVTDNDTVYFIGDIAWNYQNLPGILQRLPGKKHLIMGNHDKCFKNGHPPSQQKFIKFYLDAGFLSVKEVDKIVIGKTEVMLNHFPFRNENDPDQRYAERRPVNNGQWLIHGHIHNKGLILGRQINVSVEMWDYAPVSEFKLALMIEIAESIYQRTTTHDLRAHINLKDEITTQYLKALVDQGYDS